MLGDLSILQYMNGEQPWYAVNPVVRELKKFKRAVEGMDKVNSSGTEPASDNKSTS